MPIHRIWWQLAAGLLFASLAAAPAEATEIKVLSSGALSNAAPELSAVFSSETGHEVEFVFGSPGVVNERLAAGEEFHLVIMPTEAAQAQEAQGKWRPGTRQPLVRVGIGLAVREGTVPDLSTVENTRQVLLDASSIVMSDGATGGLSRPNATKVIANLGLTGALADKIQYARGGQRLVGTGEAEIGLYNLSEIPRAEGVARAGPVPEEVQVYIVYDSAVPAGNDAPGPALALVDFLSHPEARATWEEAGLRIAED